MSRTQESRRYREETRKVSLGEGDSVAACNDVLGWRGTRKGDELLKQKEKSKWYREAGDSI